MSTQATEPPVDPQGSGTETCPCCGQVLLTQKAARRLRQSEAEFEQRLEAAARARVTERTSTRVTEPESQHPERLERPPGEPDEDRNRTAADAEYAETLDDLRRLVRQF
jgi:hypothetical protein